MKHFKTEPITAAAFIPFGALISIPPDVKRVNFAAPITNLRPSARANLALVRPPLATLPCRVSLMERHCHSTQAFVPMGGLRALIFVAPGGDAGPNLSQARSFIVAGDIGISYAVGIWHIGMACLSAPGIMAMLVHEDGSAEDTEFREIPTIELTS